MIGDLSKKDILVGGLLLFLAAVVNQYPVELINAVTFVFGSVISLLALRLYGIKAAMICSLISGYVISLAWGHYYAMITFSGEILFIYLVSKRIKHYVVASGLYWIFVGVPLGFILFGVIVGMPQSAFVLISLKQAINGIFNASLASIILMILPRFLEGRSTKITLQAALFNFVVTVMFLPTLYFTTTASETFEKNERRTIFTRLESIRDVLKSDEYSTSSALEAELVNLINAAHFDSQIQYTISLGKSPDKILHGDFDMSQYVSEGLPDYNHLMVLPKDPNLPLIVRWKKSFFKVLAVIPKSSGPMNSPANGDYWFVNFYYPMSNYIQVIENQNNRFLMVVAAMMFGTMILAQALTSIVIPPLARLAEISNKTAENEGQNELGEKYSGSLMKEIDDLTQAYSKMQTAIQNSFNEINAVNASLEDEVKKRTHDLETLAEEQKSLRLKAEASERSKSKFLATMSHEIRTPLTGVIGYADLLLSDDLSDMSKEKVQRIKGASDALLSIINDILDISKLDAEKLTITKHDFNLRNLVKETNTFFNNSYNTKKSLDLISNIDADCPSDCSGDFKRIRQILFNLVGNAIKFTNDGSVTVNVHKITEDGHDFIQFDVIDTGIGIKEDALKQLFSDFMQADDSISRKFDGTGLGLAISKRLTRAMGGEIWAKSTFGEGSQFSFTVPYVASEKSEKSTDNQKEKTEVDTSPVKAVDILIAEDNSLLQTLMNKMLTKAGHSVSIAANGKEAVAQFKEHDFDIILMDIRMPEMSGLEACQIIRNECGDKGKNIPIVAVTADLMGDSKQTYLKAGMNDVVEKPIKMDILNGAIAKYTS